MPKFKPYDYNQSAFVSINYEDQLQPGTFEHALHYLIDNRLDLSIFHPRYKNDEVGRPAYDPAILLKIILFAYFNGIKSSREIQWCCRTNIIFKALSCDAVPHFTTLAHFVSGYSAQIAALFEQIVLICDEQGLLGKELFAIDGCKMSSNAAKEWSGTFDELANKRDKIKQHIAHHLEQHQQCDAADTPLDEQRRARTEQALKTLNNAHDKIERFLNTNTPRMGHARRPKEVKSNITDNESAKMKTSKGTLQGYNGLATVDKKHQVIVDAQAFGEGQEHHTLQPILEAVRTRFATLGIDDDIFDSGTIVTADTGFSNEKNMRYVHDEGIDAYIPDNKFRSRDPRLIDQKDKYANKEKKNDKNKDSTFPSSAFTFDRENNTCVCPAGESLRFRVERTDERGVRFAYFEGRLRQCRHCSMKHQCMKNPSAADHRKGNGRQVSFSLNKPTTMTYTQWMKPRVDSAQGKLIYSHRMSVVEPVFANIGFNKRLNRFMLRTKEKVQTQWRLYCMVHNIEKLANYGQMMA